MSDPDPDRYVGSAKVPVPLPTTAVPYDTEQLHPAPRPRRSLLFVAGVTAGAFILLVMGVIVGLSLRLGSPTAQEPPPPQAPAPAVTTPSVPVDSPRLATEQFLAAVVAGDQPGTQERLCGLMKSGDSGSGSGGLNLPTGLVSYKVGEERITGPTASVDVELTVPFLGAVGFDVYLLQESGGWRVCGLGPA